MIIIPDIHGRTFWKDCVKGHENEEIIFLGDYLDPYPAEWITRKEAILNFQEILEFKKAHMNNVILLLGNHDFIQYIFKKMHECRTDFTNMEKIENLFKENMHLFKVGYYKKLKYKTYLFTHAAFLKKWVEDCGEYLAEFKKPEEIIDFLNDILFTDPVLLCELINRVGYCRGGWYPHGSIVWGDIRECSTKHPQFKRYYNIFGHTQLKSQPIIEKFLACLDCRKGFILDEETREIKAIEIENQNEKSE